MTTKVYEYEARIAAIHMLRVNLKSLVAESKAIRHEERRAGVYRGMLRLHRINDVREELRYTGLALSFIRNHWYRSVEKRGSKDVDVKRLLKKIQAKMRDTHIDSVCQWVGCLLPM